MCVLPVLVWWRGQVGWGTGHSAVATLALRAALNTEGSRAEGAGRAWGKRAGTLWVGNIGAVGAFH